MSRAAAIAILALAVTACAAEATEDEPEIAGSGINIIAGQPAFGGQFPSSVYFETGCTGTKIAPRMVLTAAHCVTDAATSSPRWKTGESIQIRRELERAPVSATVAAVHVHPRWVAACEDTFCASATTTAKLDAPDIAIVELSNAIDAMPSTPVGEVAPASTDALMLVGYGCTTGVHVREDETKARLMWAPSAVVPPEEAIHSGSPIGRDGLGILAGNYSLTAGPGRSLGNGGLCPGDSGGPLFRAAPEGLVLVGINANYTFLPEEIDAIGLSMTNFHTRVDAKSRHGVYEWIASVAKLPRRKG